MLNHKAALLNKLHPRKACGHFTMRGSNAKETVFARLSCKCWNCPKCGPRKAGRYKHAIRGEAERLNLRRFLTLTLDPKKMPKDADPVEYLRDCFAELRTYWRRRYGRKIDYISVLEFHKSGLPHLHCLVDCYMAWADVKADWEAVGGGSHVHIEAVDLHRVSRYLSKYLTKDLLLSAPKGIRRITVSRGIVLNPKTAKEHKWERLKTPIEQLFRQLIKTAIDVVLDDADDVISFVVPNAPN